MKSHSSGTRNRVHSLLLGLLLSGAAFFYQPLTTATGQVVDPLAPYNPFVVRNYGGKCLDVGTPPPTSGAPVSISDCNRTTAQRIVVVEVDNRPGSKHAVWLFAGGNKVIGVKGNVRVAQVPLELQDYNGSAGQIFELDGDSIILAADRRLVVEVQHARGANGTPLVLGNRDLDDSEFWTFTSSDGSNRRPTRGFVRISQVDNYENGGELRARQDFLDALQNARWGTVIELDPNVSIRLTHDDSVLSIPAGVTIRGDRRGTRPGPQLTYSPGPLGGSMFEIGGHEVRITGLRITGPTSSLSEHAIHATGIVAPARYTAIVDHNDLSAFPVAAIEANSYGIFDYRDPRPENVRVVRNFIHHNRRKGLGYGVVTGAAGYASIKGNTFVDNRHAIAGDGTETSGYRAWFNLVLQASPDYGNGAQQDFDMHGTGNDPCSHCGGIAGRYLEIARNTFLGANRENFFLRGTPTKIATFHHNILVGLESFAIKNLGDPSRLVISDNRFTVSNPAKRLGVGDFDGDGTQDLFLATGTAWYFAPAGKAEWRYLNAQTDAISRLLFGDFDADGRTDVFTQHGYDWDVSWGGASRWETINVSGAIIGNAAVGDFVGDKRDDVFYTDGQVWYASDGGRGQFTPIATSGYRVANLRFGDFDADGKTDVFGVANGAWSVAYAGSFIWQALRPKLTESVAGLTVADFNGDRRADVATSIRTFSTGQTWLASYSGTSNWTVLRTASVSLSSAAAVGRFDRNVSADVLLWHDHYLDIAAGGTGAAVRHSRADMR